MEYKSFHLGDILSVTHGKLVSPNHVGGIYGLLNHLLQENLFTHQLPRAGKTVAPLLIKMMETKCPEFKDIDSSDVNEANWKDWLNEQVEKHGEMFLLPQLPDGIYEHKNPIKELEDMVGREKIVILCKDGEERD